MAATDLGGFLHQLTRALAAETLGRYSDSELVAQYLADGREAVFEALVRRHGPMVYRVCARVLHHPQDCEDAFQATFLLLAHNLRTLRKRAALSSWLHGVARRVALKARAQAAARRRHEAQAAQTAPAEAVHWEELRSALDAELAELPDKWRLPLILCYLEGRTQDEAAARVGWSKNTLRRRLEEARAALGRRLSRRGFWPAALTAVLVSDCAAGALRPNLIATAVGAAPRAAAGQAVDLPARVLALSEGVPIAMSRTGLPRLLTLLLALGSVLALAGLSASGAADDPPAPGANNGGQLPAGAPRPDGKPPGKSVPAPEKWLLTLPAGFRYVAVVRPLAEGRFALDDAARFSGVYEVRGRQLVLIKPAAPAEWGFVWEFRGPERLTLVGQPPAQKTGANYLGATLTRLPPAGAAGPNGEWGDAVRGVRCLIESKNEQLRFPAGAAVAVVCRVKNFGQGTPLVYHGRRYRFHLQVARQDGKPVPATPFGMKERFAPERETAIKKLTPGAEISETFALDRLFDLGRPGNYKVSFTFEVHFNGKDRPDTVSSNALMIAVVGRGGPRGKGQPGRAVAGGGQWDPAQVEGGFMFETAAEFRAYVGRADVVAAGTLRDWDGSAGTLTVAKVYRGKSKPKTLRIAANGALVAAKAGDRVLVLLRAQDGALVPHSFCAAPGVFRHSDALLGQMLEALKARLPERDGPPKEARGRRPAPAAGIEVLP